jgi:hypothetical protein
MIQSTTSPHAIAIAKVNAGAARRTRCAHYFAAAPSASARPALAEGTEANAPAPTPPSVAANSVCESNPTALGVSRTVKIDTTGGRGFRPSQSSAYDFLEQKAVILTFDDGPQVKTTRAIFDAPAHNCTKATFFSIGRLALALPDILRDVVSRGHTVGSHAMTYANIRKKKSAKDGVDEIEKGLSAVHRAPGQPIAHSSAIPSCRTVLRR